MCPLCYTLIINNSSYLDKWLSVICVCVLCVEEQRAEQRAKESKVQDCRKLNLRPDFKVVAGMARSTSARVEGTLSFAAARGE